MELTTRFANKNDFISITKVLIDNDLPISDLYEDNLNFILGLIDNIVIATIGLEKYNTSGLLRTGCENEHIYTKKDMKRHLK